MFTQLKFHAQQEHSIPINTQPVWTYVGLAHLANIVTLVRMHQLAFVIKDMSARALNLDPGLTLNSFVMVQLHATQLHSQVRAMILQSLVLVQSVISVHMDPPTPDLVHKELSNLK
jgi:hypothetical protein